MSGRALDTPFALAVLLLLATPIYLWGLGTVGFQDPDEGMYAEIAREMLANGDWIVPTFNGIPYVEKPPMMYWLTAGTLAVLGPSEFAARLWKVLPMLGAMAMTGAVGRRLFSPRVGIVGAGILATTLGSFLFSRITVTDPLLLLGVTVAAYGVAGVRDRMVHADLWFWGGIAIGVMSKGLLGLAFPLGLFGAWMLIRRDAGTLRILCTGRGILLASLVIIPWHALTAWRVPGFFHFYVLDNQVLRFLGARAYIEDGGSLGALAFLGATLFAFFPWMPLLGTMVGLAIGETARDQGVRFLLAWIGMVVGLFLVSSFRLEYYALPAFPAMALLVAILVCRADDHSSVAGARSVLSGQECRAALRRWTWVALIGGFLYCVTLASLWGSGYLNSTNIVRGLSLWSTNYRIILEQGLPLPPVSEGPYAAVLLGGGALWTLGFGAAVWCLSRRRVLASAMAIGTVGVGICLLAGIVLQAVGAHHSLKPLAERLNMVLRPQDLVIHERGLEKGGGLLFYTKHHVLVLNGKRGDLEFGSSLPGSAPGFIDTRQFQAIWSGSVHAFLVTDLPPSRSAIASATGGAPVLVTSTDTRWLYANHPVR